jgi:two-component system, NtrC family, response regulator HupR/HoxA
MREPENASILYVDDEQMCLDVFRLTFDDDYRICTAQTPAEARRLLREEKPFDVVISDQVMPELSGVTFLGEAAEASPESYRVLLTGSIGVGDCMRELAAGVVQLFIAKPWSTEHMRRVLDLANSTARMRASVSKMWTVVDNAA